MKMTRAHSNKLILLGIAAFLQVAFLNCSKVSFAEQEPALFSLESTDPNAPIVLDPPNSEMPPNNEMPPVNEEPPINGEDASIDSIDAVECELISSNQKIILGEVLQIGSNKQASRVCMSENACLRLINAYASQRDCNLSAGASSLAASEAQCTKIFPGSKGTCRNATLISDERVTEILNTMAK